MESNHLNPVSRAPIKSSFCASQLNLVHFQLKLGVHKVGAGTSGAVAREHSIANRFHVAFEIELLKLEFIDQRLLLKQETPGDFVSLGGVRGCAAAGLQLFGERGGHECSDDKGGGR